MSNFEYVFNKQDEKTAKQLYDEYKHDLPMLVVVATGFYGNREEMTFSTGQVLRLHEVQKQGRALVHDDKKHTLSVPLDYSHLFFVGNNHTEALTLRQVIDRYELPVKVKLADPHVHFVLGDDRARSLSTLKIITVHEEPYFLANTIAQEAPLKDVLPLPLYLSEVTFCPVVGLKGPGITDGGKSRMDRMLYPQFVMDIDFSRDHSDKEMVQLSEKPLKVSDNIYQNIETNIYINVGQARRRQPPSPSAPQAAEAAAADERTTAASREWRSVPDPKPDREKVYQNVADFSYTDYVTAPETKPKRPPKPSDLRPRRMPPPLPPHADAPESVPRGGDERDKGVYEIFGGTPDEQLTSSSTETESMSFGKHLSKQTRQEVSRGRPDVSTAITSELAKALNVRKKKVESSAGAPVPSGDSAKPATPGKKLDMEGDSQSTEPPWAGKVKLKPTHPNRQSVSETSKSNQTASSPPPPPPPADTQKAAASAGPLTASAAGPPPQAAAANPPTKADKPSTPGSPRVPPPAKPKPLRPAKNAAAAVAAGPDSPQAPDVVVATGAGMPAAASHPLQAPAPAPSSSMTAQKAAGGEAKPKPSTPVTTTTTPQDTATGTSTPPPAQPPPAATAIPPGHDAGVSQTQATDDASMYINQSQMAVVEPTQHKPEAKPSGQGVAPPPHSLDAMTIEDVKQLLTKLNLARFHQQFEQNQVDGVLLRELDADTLRGDFGMTRTETMRLRNFVERGHLPK